MPTVLAFDLAGRTGYAFLAGAQGIPRTGILKLYEHATKQRRFAELRAFCMDSYAVEPFDGLAYETPILVADRDKAETLRQLMGYAAVIEEVAGTLAKQRGLREFPIFPVEISEAKRAMTRNSYAKKHEMMLAAQRLKWNCTYDDEADAGAVACVAYVNLFGS